MDMSMDISMDMSMDISMDMSMDVHGYIHGYIHAYIHGYIHGGIHGYIHAYIYIYIYISLGLGRGGFPVQSPVVTTGLLMSPPGHDLALACDNIASGAPECSGCPVRSVYTCCCRIALGRPRKPCLSRGWEGFSGSLMASGASLGCCLL